MEQQPNSSEIFVETANNDVSPRRVRTNWFWFAWSQISGATKVLLVISIIMAIIQISTSVVVLAIGGHNHLSCDKPLQLYLIIFVVRIGISLPLSIYLHLFVPRRIGVNRLRRNTNRNINNSNDVTTEEPVMTNTTTAEEAVSSATTTDSDTSNTPPPHQQQELQDRPSTIVSGWADRLKSLLDLFAILWFIVGNYLVFSSSNCSSNAAIYYYTVLIWVLLGYTILIIPLLACASIIFCLPCVLVAMRTFNINVSNVMAGGTKEEIAKIPIFKYKAPEGDAQQEQGEQQPQQQPDLKYEPVAKKKNYFRRLMKHPETNTAASVMNKYLTIPKPEDAVCSICLSEYENEELVCKLWCEHHYHQDCVTEWLALNRNCPLCKRDFRGKNYVRDDSDEEV